MRGMFGGALRVVFGVALLVFGVRAAYRRVSHGHVGPLAWVVPGTLFWGASAMLRTPLRRGRSMLADARSAMSGRIEQLTPARADVMEFVGRQVATARRRLARVA